jgi:L-fucose mutarotase
MLDGISKYFSPELLATIYSMGHGDEIVLADAYFPGYTFNRNVIRADGVEIENLLEAILPLFAIDDFVKDPVVMMAAAKGDTLDQTIAQNYWSIIQKYAPNCLDIVYLERFAFYERTKNAFAVVMTGCVKKYGNIILKKGVTRQ